MSVPPPPFGLIQTARSFDVIIWISYFWMLVSEKLDGHVFMVYRVTSLTRTPPPLLGPYRISRVLEGS